MTVAMQKTDGPYLAVNLLEGGGSGLFNFLDLVSNRTNKAINWSGRIRRVPGVKRSKAIALNLKLRRCG